MCRSLFRPLFATLTFAGTLLIDPVAAQAHFGDLQAGSGWRAWNADPVLLLALPLLGWLYVRGLGRLRRRAVPQNLATWRGAAFGTALVVLIGALLSPLDALSDELASAHMVQHMLLMNVAAPLAVLGASSPILLWSLPLETRRIVGRVLRRIEAWPAGLALLRQPIAVWLIHATVLWVWHWPAFYEAALRSRLVHDLQHLSFFAAAYLFWRVVLDPVSRWRISRGSGVLYLFSTSLHASMLGAFMALSPRLWYSGYSETTPRWGLTPLEDQQLAGLIMWLPACTIYAAVAAILFGLWLHEMNKSQDANTALGIRCREI
jgi:putative membrane protein